MADARPDLFKWKRQTKPSHHRRGGIQTWIKNVQRASDEAAREVFGEGYHGILDDICPDDDALSEAQDLLDSWVKEKTLQSIQPELDFFDEKWSSYSNSHVRSQLQNHKQEHVTSKDTDFDLYRDHASCDLSKGTGLPVAGADFDEDLDEEIAVQEVVRNMLDKKVVNDNVLKDLGFESKRLPIDPRTKMELRHKQVKEKSESRKRDLEKTRREKVARKEAQLLARKQLLQEEKEKQAKAKREEMLMQKEMARIRKAMEEEHKLKKEQREKEQQLEVEAEILARSQVQQEQQMKEQKQREQKQATDEMRKLLLKEMEERAATETKMNLQLLQKYFSAWYSVLVDQRIKLGKAGAVADWKIKLRAWNAWRAYVWHIQSDKEAEAIAAEMKEKHRRDQLAYKLYRKNLLHRCFQGWQIFVHQSQQECEFERQHQVKANKMAALLEAAATGKLWSKSDDTTNEHMKAGKKNLIHDEKIASDGMAKQVGFEELQNLISEKATNRKPRRKEQNSDLSIENVEDDELFSTARQVDEIFSQGVQKRPLKLINSARSSADGHPSGYQLLPGKPLQNTWCSKPVNDKKLASSHRENALRVNPRPKQRTRSHVDKVEDLRSKLKNQQSQRKATIKRSKSTDIIDVQTTDLQGEGSVSSEMDQNSDIDLLYDLESARSGVSSKLLSREAKIKSDKPATKPLLLAMEERAKLRAERKALVEEKKRRIEEEKLAKLRLEQQQKEQELIKEKQEVLKKKREEKRLEKEREQEKNQRIEELRALNVKATEHYCTTILIKYGLSPWKQLVAMAHQNMSSAVEHHSQALVITCFYPWLQITRENVASKNQAADSFYRKLLIKRSWKSWRKYGQHMVRLEMVAEDYCAAILVKKYFHTWQDYVTTEQILYWEKERQADEHNDWRLQKLAFTYWKKLIPMAKEEREREKRRTEMRNRVKAWLPDFQVAANSSP